MIKTLARTIVALNSNARKEHIASGFAWGLLLALVPAGNLIWILLFFVSFFIKNNQAVQLLSIALLKIVLPLAAPLLDALGHTILTIESLQGAFAYLYNLPIAPFTRFNNTLVMGGLAAGLVLWLPAFLAIRAAVPVYRNKLAPRIIESKVYKAIMKLPLVSSLTKALSSAAELAGAVR
ncbi:MAG TPA: TIGR03546 family protein [bacterium]|nr:TIGR03546 family protein [bacterium]